MKYFILALAAFFCLSANTNAQGFPPPTPASLQADSNDVNKIFTKVDVEANFPGGDAGWRKYLQENLEIDKIARKIKIPKGEKQLQQTVIVKFIVDRNGNISEIAAENNDLNSLCIEEAIRVIKISPRWIAAKQNGRTVNAYRRQPITFLFEK